MASVILRVNVFLKKLKHSDDSRSICLLWMDTFSKTDIIKIINVSATNYRIYSAWCTSSSFNNKVWQGLPQQANVNCKVNSCAFTDFMINPHLNTKNSNSFIKMLAAYKENHIIIFKLRNFKSRRKRKTQTFVTAIGSLIHVTLMPS